MFQRFIVVVFFLTLNFSAYSQNNSCWFGYYQEDAANNPEDPMIGMVYLHLPGNGQFTGELIFSYQGCEGGMQSGRVSGQVEGSMISGNWSGSVDGIGVGGSYNGVLSSDEKSYSGTYTNSAGKKKIECQSLIYYVAGKGTWQVYGSKASTGLEIEVITEPESDVPFFSWTDFEDLEYYRFVIIDIECLEEEQDLEKCMMWNGEYVFAQLGYGEIYDDLPKAKSLQKGKTYLIQVLAFNEDENVIGSATKEFTY